MRFPQGTQMFKCGVSSWQKCHSKITKGVGGCPGIPDHGKLLGLQCRIKSQSERTWEMTHRELMAQHGELDGAIAWRVGRAAHIRSQYTVLTPMHWCERMIS